MSTIDIIIFISYLIGIVVFGSSFYKKNKSAETFTLGNNKIPSWVVSLSIFATFVSSISYLGLPGQAYATNWNPFVFSLSIPFASYMAVRFFVPLYRSINSPSAYTYLELRFGSWAKNYVSTTYLLTQLMRSGTILLLLALMLNTLMDINMIAIIIITGISIMLYSILGGIQAVIWTDAIQAVILILGAIICLIVIIIDIPGGLGTIIEIGRDYNKFSLGSYNFDLTSSSFWCVLIYGFFINLQNYGVDQNYIQRYMTSSTDREAKKSAFNGGMLYLPVSLVFVFIGTALFSYYKMNIGILPNDIATDKVFPYFITYELPSGLTGFLIASIFAAGMSTISTSINSSATIILTDFFKKKTSNNKKEKESMLILYLASFVFGILSIIISIAMINVKSVLDAWWQLASIFSGGMLGLFLLGYISKKVNSKAAIYGVLSGIIIIAWMSISPMYWEVCGILTSPFHKNMAIVFGTTSIFLVGFFITFLTQRKVINNM